MVTINKEIKLVSKPGSRGMKIRLFSGTSQGEVEDKTNAFIETVIASGAEIEDVQFQYSLSNYTEDNSSLRYDREGFAVCIQYSEG